MTSPPQADTVVPALAWEHAAEALAVEEAAAVTVAGPLRDELAGLLQVFRLRWVREFGSLASRAQQSGRQFASLMADLDGRLNRVSVGDATGRLVKAAADARAVGVRQGYLEAGVKAVAEQVSVPALDTIDDAIRATDAASELLNRASILPATFQHGSFATVTRVMAVAQQATNQLDRAARTVTNEQINRGISQVAVDLGAQLLWIAERDACVVCLALSGHLADENGLFDADATFGSRPMRWTPPGGLDGPPRHPNCRCRLTPWFGLEPDATDAIPRQRGTRPEFAAVDMPAALRREAERSVLNGWALASEPTNIRSQAAARLLDRITDGRAPSGWQVPQRVRSDATKDLKKGTFHKRAFPA